MDTISFYCWSSRYGSASKLWTYDLFVGLSLEDNFDFTFSFATPNIIATHRDVAIITFAPPERYVDEHG